MPALSTPTTLPSVKFTLSSRHDLLSPSWPICRTLAEVYQLCTEQLVLRSSQSFLPPRHYSWGVYSHVALQCLAMLRDYKLESSEQVQGKVKLIGDNVRVHVEVTAGQFHADWMGMGKGMGVRERSPLPPTPRPARVNKETCNSGKETWRSCTKRQEVPGGLRGGQPS